VKRWLPWVIKGGLSVGLIWWVMRKVDLAAAWDQATGIDPVMLGLGAALMVAQITLGGLRWWMVLRALGANFRLGEASKVYYIGASFTVVQAAVGDAMRIWQARRHGLSLSEAINSVMLERVITVLALVLVVAATEPVLLARVPNIPGAWVFPVLSVLSVVGIVVLSALDRLPTSLTRFRLVRGLAQLASDTRRLCFRPRHFLPTLGVAVLGHVNLSLSTYALAVGLDIDLSAVDFLVLFLPVILLMTLPISVAGWGVREAAMVAALGFVGVPEHSALALSVLFFLVSTGTALPGGLVMMLLGKKPETGEVADEVGETP
jgi:hypothetical protein